MRHSLHAASLFALALALAPVACAGEGHSCCAADKAKKQAASADAKCCNPSCPPGKCDKNAAAGKKAEVKKPATRPAAQS